MEKPKESVHSCIPSEKNSILINEVKKFPALYDTSNPDYYVLAERNKAWLQVAENCNVPADHCHLRWKSLRKRYAKERRKFKEILDGHRRPWALFPKMSFLASNVRGRKNPMQPRRDAFWLKKKAARAQVQNTKQTTSDDDMLILDANDEIVHTCKTAAATEDDEYIYEHLDDPDSALEIMKDKPSPTEKQTAIRTGSATVGPPSTRIGGSGRIRKLTPKMQNSMIAKKLKQAQQILQQSNLPDANLNKCNTKPTSDIESIKHSITGNTSLYQDKTRHIATVNPNIVRGGQTIEQESSTPNTHESPGTPNKKDTEASEKPHFFNSNSLSLKVIKLKGRNPIIFSPEEFPKLQSLLKAESSSNKEQSEVQCPPLIKVKSVENLNNNSKTASTSMNDDAEGGNLDIIHSVGLMRKQTPSRETNSHQSYSRSYSWNRPCVKKTNRRSVPEPTVKTQPDSQTRDYEIEETWNDIKEENIDDENWSQFQGYEGDQHSQEGIAQGNINSPGRNPEMWNKLSEAKLDLVLLQRKLLEEQHKKSLEYMRKEHEMKMMLLRAEIDLKRKQLNIML